MLPVCLASLLGCGASQTSVARRLDPQDKVRMIQANTTLTEQQKQREIDRVQAGR